MQNPPYKPLAGTKPTLRRNQNMGPQPPSTGGGNPPVPPSTNFGPLYSSPNGHPSLSLYNQFKRIENMSGDNLQDFTDLFDSQYNNIRERREGEPVDTWLNRISPADDLYNAFSSLNSWQDRQRFLLTDWKKYLENDLSLPGSSGLRDPWQFQKQWKLGGN